LNIIATGYPLQLLIPDSRFHIDGFRAVCSNDGMDLKGRILAVDYGEKNIGLAYSDELGLTVQPLPSLRNRGKKDFLKRLKETIQLLDIQQLVLGMPINMDGTRGDSVVRMEHISDTLKTAFSLPLIGIDERLSSVEAFEIWRDMSPRQQKKYRTADSLAAALILDRYLKET
jgi:putative holliday junction resolvase